jgi:hypothetical protein
VRQWKPQIQQYQDRIALPNEQDSEVERRSRLPEGLFVTPLHRITTTYSNLDGTQDHEEKICNTFPGANEEAKITIEKLFMANIPIVGAIREIDFENGAGKVLYSKCYKILSVQAFPQERRHHVEAVEQSV